MEIVLGSHPQGVARSEGEGRHLVVAEKHVAMYQFLLHLVVHKIIDKQPLRGTGI